MRYEATPGRRVWSLFVLMPTSFMSGYGFLWGLASGSNGNRSPVFDTMTAVIPEPAWGVGWLIVGFCCLIGGIIGSWEWLRVAVVLSWTLSTGALFSVLWARFVNDMNISSVAISWAYMMWSASAFSALAGQIVPGHRPIPERKG